MDAYNKGLTEVALARMEACARNGDPVACYLAAVWCSNGEGAKPDSERAQQWLIQLEQLAQGGDLEAQWEIGQHYRFGDLLPLDIARANYWLERAAEAGYPEAQHHLAWFVETGQYGYPVDQKTSESWYQRAFEQRHPETLYRFAIRQLREAQTRDEAIALLREAAERGFSQAAELLRSILH